MAENGRVDQQPVRYAAAVYGSIVAAAFLTPFHEEHSAAETALLAMLSTLAVFWLAHVWATNIGEHVAVGRGFGWGNIAAIAQVEWPLVEAAALPSVPLVLGWVGVIGSQTAIDLAIALCIAQLLGWGIAVGWHTYGMGVRALGLGLVDGGFGVLIVVLEVAIVP